LFFSTQARADRRVLLSAALVGAGLGLALGALYLAGGLDRAVVARSHAAPMAAVVAEGVPPAAHLDSGRVADRLTARVPRSASDLDCLTQAVYFEARGEPARGQAAVAQVVLNRVRHPAFPRTVCGVVYQGAANGGCQFSFACDGSMRRGREVEAWARARQIAARALSGFVLPDVGGATYFHAASVHPGWGPNMLRVAQVGLHVFYKMNPHPTYVVAPRAQPQLERAVFAGLPADGLHPPTELRVAVALAGKAADGVAGSAALSPAPATPTPIKPAPVKPAVASAAPAAPAKSDHASIAANPAPASAT
jgi:hypothetical protein